MGLLMANMALIRSTAVVEKILVTMTPTAGFTVGFNLTFTGSIDIDFKDGSGKEALTSGVEKTHVYAASTYIAEITGDLENITQFIADNNRITLIENLKTGLLTDLRLFSNLFTTLDLSLAPVSELVYIYSCANLTGVTFASSGNALVTQFVMRLNPQLTSLNLSNVPVSGLFDCRGCSAMNSLTFATSGNGLITIFRIYDNTNLLGVINLSNNPVGGTFDFNNSGVSGFSFATSGNTKFTIFRGDNCPNLTSLNLTNNPIGGSIVLQNSPLLTSLTLATSGNTVLTNCDLRDCNFTSLDFSNNPLSVSISFSGNPNLNSLALAPSGNGVITAFSVNDCDLPNVDFSVFPTSDGDIIRVFNNNFTSTEHDNQLINLDSTGWINGGLEILTGNTARTSASDTAYNNLIANGWTIT